MKLGLIFRTEIKRKTILRKKMKQRKIDVAKLTVTE